MKCFAHAHTNCLLCIACLTPPAGSGMVLQSVWEDWRVPGNYGSLNEIKGIFN